MPNVALAIATRDLGRKVIAALARKGITVINVQALPDFSSPMPFANADRGYVVNDNGCGRVWTRREAINAACE